MGTLSQDRGRRKRDKKKRGEKGEKRDKEKRGDTIVVNSTRVRINICINRQRITDLGNVRTTFPCPTRAITPRDFVFVRVLFFFFFFF